MKLKESLKVGLTLIAILVFCLWLLFTEGSPEMSEAKVRSHVGCFGADGKQVFELRRDMVISGDSQFEVLGFHEGKHFDHFAANLEILYDPERNALVEGRRIVGMKHRFYVDGLYAEFGGTDEARYQFRQMPCAAHSKTEDYLERKARRRFIQRSINSYPSSRTTSR